MLFGIALGSNLGNRAANLQRGIDLLLTRVPGIQLTGSGQIYETEPVDCAPGTQSFLNTVIEISADLAPHALHTHLKDIEHTLGRPDASQRERNAPRTLDLDLLYAGDLISTEPALTLPHPRLHLRTFVLQPLADIRPDLILPGQHQTVAELLAALQRGS